MNDMNENAKVDWMKIVKKHKKRQKGLPALSTLNTNAGNVEHNIHMFNHMNTPVDAPSNNPVSGPFGGDASASSSAMGESVSTEHRNTEEVVDLHFKNIPIDVETGNYNPTGYYSPSFGNWLPDDPEITHKIIDWVYPVNKQNIAEFLQDDPDVQNELGTTLSDSEYQRMFDDKFEELLDKYMDKVLDHYYEDAINDAKLNYKLSESRTDEENSLDDKFDLSLRTLL